MERSSCSSSDRSTPAVHSLPQSMGHKNRVRKDLTNVGAYDDLNKEDLREILKRRGLQTTGKKQVLVKRLERFDRDQYCQVGVSSHLNSSTGSGRMASNGMTHSPSIMVLNIRQKLRKERESIVLWRHPLTTLYYFFMELQIEAFKLATSLRRNLLKVILSLCILVVCLLMYHMEGPHQRLFKAVEKKLLWSLYWVGLGILSSVGLGTGLHTFVLYLGPHIAAVTMAADECHSLRFPEPPYPDEIQCPDEGDAMDFGSTVTIWAIMSKVRLESFMWGAGTALGELPPYFMARAARLSGTHPDDEDYEEFEDLQVKLKHPEEMSYADKAKLAIERLVERVGFFGILACASIPNPLFDLAGITCGHFLVPFWTFFGATLIGKAVIKMHIQKLFVIIAFNEAHVEMAVHSLRYIPWIGEKLQAPFKDFLDLQKQKFHRAAHAEKIHQGGSWLQWVFEKVVIGMITYFLVSIVNSLAQRYHRRMNDKFRPKVHKQK